MARDCVAIVVNDLPNPNRRTSFSERILNQAVFEITRRNLLSEIISVDELARLYNGYTKAVLLLMSENYIEQHLEQFRRLSMPILTVNKQYDFSSSVNTDHGEGVRLALEHLHAEGHRRIGLTVDRFNNQAGRRTARSLPQIHDRRRVAGAAGRAVHRPGLRRFQRRLTTLLDSQPTALIACGEGVALPVFHELQERGFRIPDDISLITGELAGVSCWMTPELTTIDQDLDALARATITQLVTRIRNPQLPRSSSWLPTTLIKRNSVKKIQ